MTQRKAHNYEPLSFEVKVSEVNPILRNFKKLTEENLKKVSLQTLDIREISDDEKGDNPENFSMLLLFKLKDENLLRFRVLTSSPSDVSDIATIYNIATTRSSFKGILELRTPNVLRIILNFSNAKDYQRVAQSYRFLKSNHP